MVLNFVKARLTTWHFQRRDSDNDENIAMTVPQSCGLPDFGPLNAHNLEGSFQEGGG